MRCLGLCSDARPQRAVTLEAGSVIVPYGPCDPSAYKDWVNALPPRFGGGFTKRYVADLPGVPTKAELDTIKHDVSVELRKPQPGPP